MHPKIAAITVDAVVAYSCTTDSAWVFTWTLQEVQACTTDHDLVFPAFTLNPFFSMASFHIKSLLTYSSRESAMLVLTFIWKKITSNMVLN